MALTKGEIPLDERIGNDPPPKSERELVIEQIIELQRQITKLERYLNELDGEANSFLFRPPAR
jgi:hypothetical protein